MTRTYRPSLSLAPNWTNSQFRCGQVRSATARAMWLRSRRVLAWVNWAPKQRLELRLHDCGRRSSARSKRSTAPIRVRSPSTIRQLDRCADAEPRRGGIVAGPNARRALAYCTELDGRNRTFQVTAGLASILGLILAIWALR